MNFLLALLLCLGIVVVPVPVSADLHVLIYHRFGEDRYPTTNIDVDSFRNQMIYLRDNNYKVVSLDSVVTALKDKRPIPDRAVVITIDDGYKSTYTEAWPILKKFRYPFTIFLNIHAVENGYHNILTWNEIKEIQAAGGEIQDHSYAHHRLADWPEGKTEHEYRSWIRNDLRKGADILTTHLGIKPKFFAIPYGEYNHIVIDEATRAGYEAILSQYPGVVSPDTSRFQIPREPILGYEWGTMDHFKMILERRDLPCTEIQPLFVPPADLQPFHISARLLHPQRYDPESLDIYVSELGWIPASLHGDRLATDKPVTLHKRLNRVAIKGKERSDGRTAIHFWMLLQSAGTKEWYKNNSGR